MLVYEPDDNVIHDEENEQYQTNSSTKIDSTKFKISESYLLGFDYNGEDEAVLVVIRREKDRLVVVNTFTGEIAIDIYNTLTTVSNI